MSHLVSVLKLVILLGDMYSILALIHTTGLTMGGGGLHAARLTSSAYYTVIARTAQAIKLKPYFRESTGNEMLYHKPCITIPLFFPASLSKSHSLDRTYHALLEMMQRKKEQG